MNYDDFTQKSKELLKRNITLWQQTHIIPILIVNNNARESLIGKDIEVEYDISAIWDEIAFKENEVLFSIYKYIECLSDGLDIYADLMDKKSIFIPSNEIIDKAIYYFDAFISSFYTLIEPQQRELFCEKFGGKTVDNFFPSRNEIGLYWQTYMLRNKIVHFAGGKYDNTKKKCSRYQDFSSRVRVINIDENGNLKANCTLIDIDKCEYIKNAIHMAIEDRQVHPFDVLFPNSSPKGHNKKRPLMIYINNDIFFDHISSSIKMIGEIHEFLENLNKLFLESFLADNPDKKILKSDVKLSFEGKDVSTKIIDAFPKLAV